MVIMLLQEEKVIVDNNGFGLIFLNLYFFQPVDPLKQSPWFHGALDKKIAENALKSFSKVCVYVNCFLIISTEFCSLGFNLLSCVIKQQLFKS